MLLIAFGAVAQEHEQAITPVALEEHRAHLRELLASMSSHGPVIPQPESVHAEATKNFTVTAISFSFSTNPSPFTVNQGDVVNITLTVPSNDKSTIGHGILMETYVENGLDCPRGQSKNFSFTATTAGTFAFVCDVPDCGTGHSSMFGQLKVNAVVNPAPAITSILPTSGSTGGGTVVTITGSGFVAGATVKFGGVSATNVSVDSATSITATAPAHAAGKVDVLVTNTDTKSGTLTQGFTYSLPAPTVTSVAPSTGPTSGGTLVTITGTGFQTGATVSFGALATTDVTVVSATSITARTPLGPVTGPLAVDVVVTNPDDSHGTDTGAFTYTVPALAVVSVTPNIALPSTAVGAASTEVTIFGAGFTSAATVTVGGVPAINVHALDPVTLQATFLTHTAGSADVVVTVGASSATLTNGFSWQNAPPRRRAARP
ncbi:MAG: IPT/TIG domain-containing protein [Thermoanaerobaculia bacterium]